MTRSVTRRKALYCSMAAVVLAMAGHFAFAAQTDPSNCTPTPRLAGNCWSSILVPCQNGTCVDWVATYGGTAPACPDGGGGTGAYFDSNVTATSWQICGTKEGSLDGCTLNITVCSTYTYYTDRFCRNSCGTNSMKYCRGTSNTACP